ncbi:hypothetical protein ACFYRG_00485 [Streptomyces mirabilis]
MGLGVGAKGLPDLPVDVLEPVVQGEDLCGDVRDDAGGNVVAGKHDA